MVALTRPLGLSCFPQYKISLRGLPCAVAARSRGRWFRDRDQPHGKVKNK